MKENIRSALAEGLKRMHYGCQTAPFRSIGSAKPGAHVVPPVGVRPRPEERARNILETPQRRAVQRGHPVAVGSARTRAAVQKELDYLQAAFSGRPEPRVSVGG